MIFERIERLKFLVIISKCIYILEIIFLNQTLPLWLGPDLTPG